MTGAVQTPLHSGNTLALGHKRYRKEILVKGPLHVGGDVFNVTDAYIDEVMAAFQARAIAEVPIKAAPDNNDHTRNPFRRCGTVVGLHRTARGLDADLEPDEQLEDLITRYPLTGVSVLIEHNRTTGSGEHYPAALAHLLVTEDPVINNLGPWSEALAASHGSNRGDVLDLLSLSMAATRPAGPSPRAADPTDPSEGTEPMPTLAELLNDATPEDLQALRAKLDDIAAPDSGDDDLAEEPLTDDELAEAEAIVAGILDADPEDTPASPDSVAVVDDPDAIAASHRDGDRDDKLALANAQLSEQNLALAQMRRRLDDAQWREDRDALVASNVPPVLVELAKPFLHGSDQRLALSNDNRGKAAAQVRQMLTEVSNLMKTLGLSNPPVGTHADAGEVAEQDAAEKTRTTAVSGALTNAGLIARRA